MPRITIAFHGSESVEDFTEANLLAFKKKNDDLGIDGSVHGGFNTRYMESRESLYDAIEQTLILLLMVKVCSGLIDGFKHVGQSVKLAANGHFGNLENHSLGTIKADALSPENVKFDENHVGYRERISNKASQVVKAPAKIAGYVTWSATDCGSQIAKAPAAVGRYIKSWF